MTKIVSVAKMREIEAAADAAGITYDTMMANAGHAAAQRALRVIEGLQDARVTILVGSGNNGGDGLVAGRLIAQESTASVRFYLLKHRDESDVNFKAVTDAGLFVAYAEDDQQYRVLRNMVASADLVIDALFGIGVKLPVKDEAAKVLRNVNQALNERRSEKPASTIVTPSAPERIDIPHTPYVLSLDCPSGLNCDSGELDKNAIYADETITFIAAKQGLFMFPGAAAVGNLSVASIEIPADLPALKDGSLTLVDAEMARLLLPTRPIDGHKGTFGRLLVVAGSVNYIGAPSLAAQAAYRIGAGLVTIGAPQPVVAALAAQLPEPTWMLLPHDLGVVSEKAADLIKEELPNCQALLLGPGLGRENTTRTMLEELFSAKVETPARRSRRSIGFLSTKADAGEANDKPTSDFPPLIIDADGLNLLSEIDQWWKRLPANSILTPHPGEMARLTQLDTKEIQSNRVEVARSKASEWQTVVVLKGAHTVVAAPDGNTAILPFKTDALAKAGTGDVLAGMIGGLLAQGASAYQASVVGAYIHGLAGQLAAEWLGTARSVMARDVIDSISEALSVLA